MWTPPQDKNNGWTTICAEFVAHTIGIAMNNGLSIDTHSFLTAVRRADRKSKRHWVMIAVCGSFSNIDLQRLRATFRSQKLDIWKA
jgi:hypothetical protein